MEMSNQAMIAIVSLLCLVSFVGGYMIGWGQCSEWRDKLDGMPTDDEVASLDGLDAEQRARRLQ
jgi:hypothetical protein